MRTELELTVRRGSGQARRVAERLGLLDQPAVVAAGSARDPRRRPGRPAARGCAGHVHARASRASRAGHGQRHDRRDGPGVLHDRSRRARTVVRGTAGVLVRTDDFGGPPTRRHHDPDSRLERRSGLDGSRHRLSTAGARRSYHPAMPMWRCPHCGTPQAETARCWVCRRSSTSCGTCRHYRRSVAASSATAASTADGSR